MKRLLCALFGHKPLYSQPHLNYSPDSFIGWWYECKRCGDWALSSDRLIIQL